MSRKMLLIFFSFLFLSGFLVLIITIIIPLILQSEIIAVTDLVYRLLSFGLVSLALVVVFYLRTGGSPRQLRVFWTVIVALIFAFPFTFAFGLIAITLLGQPEPPPIIPLYLVGLAIGALIGYWVGRRESKGESDKVDSG